MDGVRDWSQRTRRSVKPVKTYWEEFVETDTWYTKKLIEDIPDEEMVAALIDEDFDEEEGESEGSDCGPDEEESDTDFLMGGESTDADSDDESVSGEHELSGDGLENTDSGDDGSESEDESV